MSNRGNFTCPTRPAGDSTNAQASTEFVTSAIDIYTYAKCDNIATLRQNPVEDGKAFIVGGYYQVGDGASGIFYPSPTVPKAQFTGSIAMVGGETVLTVSAIASGIIYAGMKLTGDLIATQLYIARQLTGTNGGVGTYALYDQTGNSPILTIPSSSMTGTMYWDNGGTVILPTGGDGTRAWLREVSGPINVKWFGAKGDGISDDTTKIKAAINVGQVTYFPQGQYYITSSLPWKGSIVGEGYNAVTGVGYFSAPKIICSDVTFPAFVYDGSNTDASKARKGIVVENLIVSYSAATGGVAATNSEAKAFSLTNTTYYLAESSFRNVYVECAYWAYYDTSFSYTMSFANVMVRKCKGGFYKYGGTTFTFNTCLVSETELGWSFTSMLGLSLFNCAMDLRPANCSTFAGIGAMYFNLCYGLVISSFDFENNYVNHYAIRIDSSDNFSVTGFYAGIGPGVVEVDLVDTHFAVINNSFGVINSSRFGAPGQSSVGTKSTYNLAIIGTFSGVSSSNLTMYPYLGTSGISDTLFMASGCSFISDNLPNQLTSQNTTLSAGSKFINDGVVNLLVLGDSNYTKTIGLDGNVFVFKTTLTANRTFNETGLNHFDGNKFKVITSGIGGTYNVSVLGAKTLSNNQWVEYTYSDSAANWLQTGFGSL